MNPIKAFRLYREIKSLLERAERTFSMRLSWNSFIQILGLVGQGANIAYNNLPGKGQFYAALTMGAVQAVVGLIGQFYNPDGTPAKNPWVPK
jgi:hypothetical protein